MGRKKTKKETDNYFGVFEEEMVVKYIQTEDIIKKNKIYEDHLNVPLRKLIESIINTYKLYSTVQSYQDLFEDIVYFLFTKIDKFNPQNGAKAYSYYGTIVKRKLQNIRMTEAKEKKKTILYEDCYEAFAEDERFVYEIDDTDELVESEKRLRIFGEMVEVLKTAIDEDDLSPTDRKVAIAIVQIMQNYKTVFDAKTIKFNKNQVMEVIKNLTNLHSKIINISLKNFKILYLLKKKEK